MKTVLKLEEVFMTAIGIFFLSFYNLDLPVWVWILLFFSPDSSMIGYLVNPKVGAICYNLFHHKGLAICIVFFGYYLENDILKAIGILLFSHASFDRILGYGLKYEDSFSNTHLGPIGKNK